MGEGHAEGGRLASASGVEGVTSSMNTLQRLGWGWGQAGRGVVDVPILTSSNCMWETQLQHANLVLHS